MALARRLRVLHIITESRPLGGAQQNTLALLVRSDRRRFDSHLACGPGGPLIDAAQTAGVPVHVVSALTNSLRPLADARALRGLVALCRGHHFDIVHTHSTKAGVLGRAAAALCRVPVVIHTIHGVPFHESQRWAVRAAALWAERAAARWCHRLVAVGDALALEFVRAGICARDKVVTIRSGIDLSRFDIAVDRGQIRASLGVGAGDPVVGAVGHLRPAKGYPYLLQAAALLRRSWPNLRLLVAGDGDSRADLERCAQSLGLNGCCRFLGARADVPALLRAMDVFAQSSVREGVPRALQEAMYVGLPVVATAVDGTPEIVEHGVTGLLVAPRDARGLARAIAQLLADPQTAARLGAQARLKITREFSMERTVERTAALYMALAAQARLRGQAVACAAGGGELSPGAR